MKLKQEGNMFLKTLYSALATIVRKQQTPAERKSCQETKNISYVCIHHDSQNYDLALPLKKYFNGDRTKWISWEVKRRHPAMKYDIPVYDNLYEAEIYLGRHGRGGPESRYILVVNCPRDEALQLLKENSSEFHKKIMYAIRQYDLVGEHQKYEGYPSKVSFNKVQVHDNPNIKIVYPESTSAEQTIRLTETVNSESISSCTIL